MYTSQLECFVSLASTLNYVKTADHLGLTQPAVTKQIQALEQELGTRLFFRTTRTVSLSPAGQQFLPDAVNILNTFYKSKERISGLDRAARHAVRIGYSDPHSINKISQVLREMIRQDDSIVPELTYAQTDANLARLSHGQLDLIIGMKDARFSDDQIIFRKLQDERFCCVISASHPLAQERLADPAFEGTISSRELWPWRQIISIPPYLMKNYFSKGRTIVPANEDLDNIICANSNEAYGLVIAGAGYSFIPSHLLMKHPDLLFWEWTETPHAPMGIYYHKPEHGADIKDIRDFIRYAQKIYPVEQGSLQDALSACSYRAASFSGVTEPLSL